MAMIKVKVLKNWPFDKNPPDLVKGEIRDIGANSVAYLENLGVITQDLSEPLPRKIETAALDISPPENKKRGRRPKGLEVRGYEDD